jgi:hypothetical protein
MRGRPVHRLRHLQAFLDSYMEPAGDRASNYGALFALLLMGVVVIFSRGRLGPVSWIALFALGALMILLGIIGVRRKAEQPFRHTEFDVPARRSIDELRRLSLESQLEDRMDAEAGDLVDDCAQTSLEISAVLDQPEWNTNDPVRLEAKAFAKSANFALMGDALVIAMSAIRAKGARRDSFARRMSDPKIKVPILDSLRSVLHNLELLKSEVSGASFASSEDSDAFRTALSKLQEIRAAEEELRATIG